MNFTTDSISTSLRERLGLLSMTIKPDGENDLEVTLRFCADRTEAEGMEWTQDAWIEVDALFEDTGWEPDGGGETMTNPEMIDDIESAYGEVAYFFRPDSI